MIAAWTMGWASMRSRRRSALLLVLVFASASLSGVTGLAASSALTEPWDEIYRATHGAHVRITAPTQAEAREIAATLPKAVEIDESRQLMFGALRTGDGDFPVAILVAIGKPTLDVPLIVEGSGDHGIWLEYSHARALGLRAGDPISMQRPDGAWVNTVVSAVVASTATPPYPSRVPGLGFMDEATRVGLGLGRTVGSTVSLRMADPTIVESQLSGPSFEPGIEVSTAREVREAAVAPGLPYQAILDSFSFLLLACAVALVAIAIGGQMAVDRRLHARLSAAGSTPAQIAAAASLEHGLGAALGACVGVVVAMFAARAVLTAAGPDLGWETPGVGISDAAVVVVLMAAAGAATSWIVAYRTAIRHPRLEQPVIESRLGRWALDSRLPVGLAIGLKDALGKPARAAMAAAAVGLAVVAGVAALNMEATFAAEARERVSTSPLDTGVETPLGPLVLAPNVTSDEERLRPLVYGLEAVLLLVAGSTVFLATSLDARERRAESATLLASGFTPGQLALARSASTGATAILGVAVGIPAGIGFFYAVYGAANGSSDGAVIASWQNLALAGFFAFVLTAQLAFAAAVTSSKATSLPVALRLE